MAAALSFSSIFYINNVTNLHHLTSHSTTSCPTTWRSYRDHILLWRYFTVSIPSLRQRNTYIVVALYTGVVSYEVDVCFYKKLDWSSLGAKLLVVCLQSSAWRTWTQLTYLLPIFKTPVSLKFPQYNANHVTMQMELLMSARRIWPHAENQPIVQKEESRRIQWRCLLNKHFHSSSALLITRESGGSNSSTTAC